MMFIVEAFLSGCISKVINDVKDYSWNKIKKAINDKNDRSLSTRIYRVIEKALIKVTDKKFKGTDILYEAIEKIFIEFRDNGSTIESVRCGLGMLSLGVTTERCKNFLEKFYEELCQDDDLYKVISLLLQEKGIQINQKEFKQLNESVEYGFDQLNRKIDNLTDNTIENSSNNEENETATSIKFQNNKKQDYIKNWNSRLFLHIDNDENPITLTDAFIMPNYEMQQGIERIGVCNSGILDKAIDKFIIYHKTSILLIVGDPGIGKSTITSWIADKYKDDDRVIILRFRDWESEELEKGLLKAIYTILNCKKLDLNNKIIILDGFDEIKSLHIGELLLSNFLNDILDFDNVKFIITSRPDYVKFDHFENAIKLLPFNVKQISKFYQIITNKEIDETKLYDKNIDVFGIPVILYMAIMSNIDITKSATKPELYGRIFKKKGGIFDKFSHEGVSYDNGSQVLRSIENIEIYLDFLQKTAFKMFEKNISYLMREEYQIPKLFFQGKYVNVLEFPIRHLFENTKSNIEFIHKSIYEFFVSEYIFQSIYTLKKIENEEIDFAICLANILKYNPLSKEILEFLKHKIRKSELNDKFNIVKEAFQLMLRDGMIYQTKKICENIIKYEMNVFTNMLEIIHLWEFNNLSIECDVVDKYLRYKHDVPLNLSNFNFEGVNLMYLCLSKANLRNSRLINIKAVDAELEEADLTDAKMHHIDLRFANLRAATLTEIDLRDADLRKANFQDADLIGADLRGAILCKADLRGAVLVGISLEGVDITDAIISESQIGYLEKKYDMHGTKVYIEKTREVISYEKYQKRRDRKNPHF